MDEITTKAIIIGVSVFVTLIIVTVIVFEFSQIQSVYKITAETNVSFEDRLDEFDKYRDSSNYFNGLDVKNTKAKYSSDKSVDVCLKTSGVEVCNDSLNIPDSEYNREYKVSLEEIGSKFKIIFEKE